MMKAGLGVAILSLIFTQTLLTREASNMELDNQSKQTKGKIRKSSSEVICRCSVESFFIIKLKRPSISTFGVKDFSGTRGSQVLNLRIVFDEVVIN